MVLGTPSTGANLLAAVTADDDDALQTFVLDGGGQLGRAVAEAALAVWILEGIALVGGAQEGAPAVQQAPAGQGGEVHRPAWLIQQAVEAVFDAHHLPVQAAHAVLHDGADDGVESRGVAAAGHDPDSMFGHAAS
jgi:hypothetical protein